MSVADATIAPAAASTLSVGEASRRCDVVSGAAALAAIAGEWDALFARASHASMHMARPWCEHWIEKKRSNETPMAVCLRAGDQLVGLLPLMTQRAAGGRIGRPMATGRGAYLGVLVRDDFPEAPRLLAQELSQRRIIDAYVSHDLSSRDEPTEQFLAELQGRGWSMRLKHRDIVRCSELEPTYDEFLNKNKSSKSRQTMRRKERGLLKEHQVAIDRFVGPAVDDAVIQRCAAIHAESWMMKRGGAFMCDPFYRRLVRRCAAAGLMEAWVMTIDGEDAAFVVSGVAHGVHYYEWPAFKLKFHSGLSVGQTLISRVIADACADGLREFDFGHGDGEYKRFWGNAEHSVERVVAGRGARGRLIARLIALSWDAADLDTLRKPYRKWKRQRRKKAQAGSGGAAHE